MINTIATILGCLIALLCLSLFGATPTNTLLAIGIGLCAYISTRLFLHHFR